MHEAQVNSLLRLPRVSEATGLSRSTLYEKVRVGLFPPPVKIGRTSVWPARDVRAYTDAVIAGAAQGDLRELVGRIVQERAMRSTA